MTTHRFTAGPPPRICVTLADPSAARDAEAARRANARYLDALTAAGAQPIACHASQSPAERARALETMDGLLLSGGADLDPALYGEPPTGAVNVQPERDALEHAAWEAARRRRLPVLGICRGFEAINVFSGGRLVQHVDGHDGSEEHPTFHALRVHPGSRLARILRPTGPSSVVLQVNSFHHQAVTRAGLAAGLTVAGTSPGPGGELVEAFEASDPGSFILGVQCHPERTESTPREFARLWTVCVDAARGGASARGHPVG